MCFHPDCPNPERSKHLKAIEDVKDNPRFNLELDKMPDGYHAKPLRLWVSKPQKSRLDPSAPDEELSATRDRLMKLWAELPEPKPDPLDFAAYHTRWDQWFELYRISKIAPLFGDRIKANAVLLDFAKIRPKQSYEISSGQQDVDIDELLVRILRVKGWHENQIEALLRGEVRIQ